MTTRSAIVTLVFFFVSGIFITQPLSFHVPLPFIGKQKVTVGLMTAPIMAIAILWASQCLGATQIRNGIVGTDNIKPYAILISFISLAYMAITLDVAGILQAAVYWVNNKGGASGRRLYLYRYVLRTLNSIVIGNNSLILNVTVSPVHHTVPPRHPDAWLVSEFAAANIASMVLFIGNPTNVIICEGFRINNAVFTAYTILPFVTCSIACYLALMLQYRNEKHVPRNLNVSEHPNPREVLRDPVSAIFGSVCLATCLTVVIVLSFFHVDAWKTLLPFAGGKFIFDICWDHYRYSNKLEDVESVGDPMRAMSDDMQRNGTINTFTGTLHRNDTTPEPFAPTPHPHNEPEQLASLTIQSLSNTFQRVLTSPTSAGSTSSTSTAANLQFLRSLHKELAAHFPTFFTALPRIPFTLVPFAFSQFILIEALEHQGWIDIFARWLVAASNKQIIPMVWLVGVSGVILCNISGTSIGATILLTKVIRASDFPGSTARAAAVSLAVASNIGAVNFTFSASFGGWLWVAIWKDERVEIEQWRFAMWNALPLVVMVGAGLGIVSAMMVILY